MEVLFLMQKG